MTRPQLARQNPDQEAEMVRGLQTRRPDAIATFVDRSHRAVFALACNLGTDPEQRQDWTHSVLLQIIEELGRGVFVYRRPGGFWMWFRKRAYYLMLNQLNAHRARYRRERRCEDLEAVHALPGSRAVDSPAEVLERTELRGLLEEGLARVDNPDQRRALWLLLDRGLSYQEIADEMGAELNTVRSWIRRGRAAMRRFIVGRLEPGLPDSEVA